jgi:hypothetical protein
MRMRRWSNFRKLLLVGLGVLVFLVLFAHPFFATTRPSGAKVLLAEGWMHHEGLREAAALFHAGGYERLYVSGTLRPFAYYLEAGDTLEVQPNEAFAGTLELGTAGLPGTTWTLLSDAGELAQGEPPAHAKGVSIAVAEPVSVLRITATVQHAPGEGIPVLFIGTFQLNGANPHALRHRVRILRANGNIEDGRPTFAEEGAALMRDMGIPSEAITAVPTYSTADRTRLAAEHFGRYALENNLPGYDVATLGVHARRTWKQYARASAPIPVGVVSLEDPWCRRWTWWLNPYGWFQVLKELIALPGLVG